MKLFKWLTKRKLKRIKLDAEANIPDGYKIVTAGLIRESDLAWNTKTKTFESVLSDVDPVAEVSAWYCVIRGKSEW